MSLKCRQLVSRGFVEIVFGPELAGKVHGATFTFSAGGEFAPCSLCYGLDVDSLGERVAADVWGEAVYRGRILSDGTIRRIFWNLFHNRLHVHRGPVWVRAEVLTPDGLRTVEKEIDLEPTTAVYLHDWANLIAGSSGWKVDGDSVTTVDDLKQVTPLRLRPGLAGEYDVYLALPHGTLSALLKLSHEPNRYPVVLSHDRPEFYHKHRKEIFWKTSRLVPDSVLEIGLLPHSLRYPDRYPFGRLAYVKFVPVASRRRARPVRWPDRPLALYFEPYSWAFLYELDEPRRVREAVSLFREMGADEIHTQVIRFGSRALHHSRVAERLEGETAGDDETLSGDPPRMVRSLDVLRETIRVCRELGITHYANAGLTICYQGTALEDRISREHPEWRKDNFLRFCHAETRAYAAAIVREFVE